MLCIPRRLYRCVVIHGNNGLTAIHMAVSIAESQLALVLFDTFQPVGIILVEADIKGYFNILICTSAVDQ